MSLEHVEEGINEVRAQADPVLRSYTSATAAIKNDPNLSEEGKAAHTKELAAEYRTKLNALRDREAGIVNSEIDRLERMVASTVGTTGSDVIAYRDAQDRAERLDSAEKAQALMDRALRTGDKSLAHAVFGRAIEKGYRDVARTYTDLYPSLKDVASDLAELKNAQRNTMGRNMYYAIWGSA